MRPYGTIRLVMKRFFAILLMLILPLQFSFAAASAYCADEANVAVEHYGHHAHEGKQAPPDPDTTKKSAGEPECGACHLGCAKLQTAALIVGSPDSTLPVEVAPLLSAAQYQPSPLQRPPIASLA